MAIREPSTVRLWRCAIGVMRQAYYKPDNPNLEGGRLHNGGHDEKIQSKIACGIRDGRK